MRTAASIAMVTILAAGLLATYCGLNFQNAHVQGDSMAPALRHGDRLVAQKWGRSLERGSIVTIDLHDGRDERVKRLTGLPGDTVGAPYAEALVTLGKGEYWVNGDNLGNSVDSRHFGSVKRENITGIVIHIRKMK